VDRGIVRHSAAGGAGNVFFHEPEMPYGPGFTRSRLVLLRRTLGLGTGGSGRATPVAGRVVLGRTFCLPCFVSSVSKGQ